MFQIISKKFIVINFDIFILALDIVFSKWPHATDRQLVHRIRQYNIGGSGQAYIINKLLYSLVFYF